ncbi:MAG: hypothetical protein J6Z38_00620 [Lachnospiraceae bacterium]|nr:hypothetical protein [Lachnospiraceae bacterium]
MILLAFASLLFASALRARDEAEELPLREDVRAAVLFEEALREAVFFLVVFDLELAFAANVLSL